MSEKSLDEILLSEESFRDHIPYEDEKGKRRWIYPRKPKGRFHNYRIGVAAILLTIFFILPFISIQGHPFFLINIFERKFIILGKVFWPQDTHLLILLLLIFFVSVILFTVAFGRIWCGWTCPQTVFMEMVFRKIEFLIEGDANAQRKLAHQTWNAEKLRKRGVKHALFVLVSLVVSHTVMMYLIGKDQVLELITHSPVDNPAAFGGMLLFTGIFYFVFSILREHACTFVCPYGRLQGVLINPETIVVAYDFVRGEPRGRLHKGQPQPDKGDCVDCGLCVQVCPTGIDIRNGTQLECVNCTACIDACDEVMDKIKKPRGLIRYASMNDIRRQKRPVFNVRLAAYSGVLIILVSVFIYLFFSRRVVETTVLRASGQLFTELDNGMIRNIYTVQVVNKSFDSLKIRFRAVGLEGHLRSAGGRSDFVIPNQGLFQEVFLFDVPKAKIETMKTPITLEVWSDEVLIDKVKTTFLGPSQNNIKPKL